MNKLVAAATAAAAAPVVSPSIATAAPAIAPALPAEWSAAASPKRAEEVVELLRTRYIREGWKIDEDAAARALAYCRDYATDGSGPADDQAAALDSFHDHGISLDWVFRGDVAGLICGVAMNSARANAIADAELLAL